jgi:hypothetical protein
MSSPLLARKLTICLFACLLPSAAYASGSEVLSLLWLQLLALVGVALVLWLRPVNYSRTILCLAAYLAGAVLIFKATDSMPYRGNMLLTNALCTLIPLATFFAAYSAAKGFRPRSSRNRS